MKLMERVKAALRVKRYGLRTEKTYCYWIRFFIRFHRMRHPAIMAGNDVRQFLEYLAIERRVAAATQNQALNAIVFLYPHVLEQLLGEIGTFSRAKRRLRLSLQEGRINNQIARQIVLLEAGLHLARNSLGEPRHGKIRLSGRT